MLAGEALNVALAILRPKIMDKKAAEISKGKVVLGTVFGDVQDIGKNLVSIYLSVAGYEVFDIGVAVITQDFVKKAEELRASIIGLSCLISPSMYYQRDVIELLKAMGIREKYHVIVGGATITPEWAEEIESDGYAEYCVDAAKLCDKLIKSGKTPGMGKPIVVGK